MKKIFWNASLILSMLFMVVGFITSVYGIFHQLQTFVYMGLMIIGVTCISWWIWVMIVIKQMYDVTKNSMSNIGDVREAIKEIKILVEEYKKLTRDK